MPKFLTSLLSAVLSAAVLAISAKAQQKIVRLNGTNSPELRKARLLAPLEKNELVQFAFTLPVRKQAALDDYLKHLYTPGDPLYRKYLLKGEFEALFGPTQEQYEAVIDFAQRNGLSVVGKHSNRLVLDVAGRAETVERALSVRMMRFQSPNGRIFRAPDQEPALSVDIAPQIAGIVDLDKSIEPKSNHMLRAPRREEAIKTEAPSAFPSGPAGGFAPADIKTAYNLNGLSQNGSGQTIALFELDGFYNSDINAYDSQFGLPTGTVNVVSVGDTSAFPTAPTSATPDPSGVIECTLDIEMAKAAAPNATILVYEGTNFVSIYNRIASDNAAQQVSTSWYYGTDSATPASVRNAENTAFQQMAGQGQSLYGATGDFGDQVKTGTDASGNPIFVFGVQDPSAQPYITAVGGTKLTVDAFNGAYKSETAWTGNTTGGSTGGISTVWTLPVYQSLAVSPGSNGSSTFRNLPDVSLNSDPNTGYSVYRTSGFPTKSGSWIAVGGTSVAAPLWAAYTALVNQNRVGLGTGNLGFANPTLYFVAHARFSADFHDITSGNNGTYSAVSGYDNVTGWGTFNGGNMFSDLTRDAAVFWVDGSYTGSLSNGGQTTPFKKVSDALNTAVIDIPTLIYIRGGAYNETFSNSKPIVFVNNGNGNATLGSSTVK